MILVTGGSGLVGAELIKQLLAKNKMVKAIFHRTPLAENLTHPNLIVEQADILDVISLEEIMEDITEIYHCAGMVSFLPEDRERLYKINVEGTANLVNAALNAGVKKLVHVSSVAALGRIRKNQLVTEKMEWTKETSNSIYGHSKYLGEMEVWRGQAEGLNTVVVNPSIILGAGDWNDGSTKIFKSVYEEFPWYTTGITGFVDVRDLVTVMILLMESEISAEKFVVSAHNESYRNLFNLIADAFHKKRPAKEVTPFIAGIVYRQQAIKSWFTKEKPLITKETALTAMAKTNFSNEKLLAALPGFKFTGLSETVAHTCKVLQQKINSQ